MSLNHISKSNLERVTKVDVIGFYFRTQKLRTNGISTKIPGNSDDSSRKANQKQELEKYWFLSSFSTELTLDFRQSCSISLNVKKHVGVLDLHSFSRKASLRFLLMVFTLLHGVLLPSGLTPRGSQSLLPKHFEIKYVPYQRLLSRKL